MSVERQRTRLVGTILVSALVQDVFLFGANVALAVGHSLQNFATSFSFVEVDSRRKYADLTGSPQPQLAPVREEEDDGEE